MVISVVKNPAMSSTKIEFAVHMTCNSCVDAVKKSLQDVSGVNQYEIDKDKNSVVVDTILPTLEIQKALEKSGRKVVVRGYEGSSAAVAVLDTGNGSVQGVVRFIQVTPNSCLIDGTIDGLTKTGDQAILSVHECGDLSQGCNSVGPVFNPTNATSNNRIMYGHLGSVHVEEGRANFRFEDDTLKLSDVIGRSLVVGDSKGNKLTCGIIARSAGLFENPKTICACDGISIWDEQPKSRPKSTL